MQCDQEPKVSEMEVVVSDKTGRGRGMKRAEWKYQMKEEKKDGRVSKDWVTCYRIRTEANAHSS